MKYNKFYNILYSLIVIITGFSIGFFVYGLLFITAQYNYVIVPQIKTARAESLSASCSVTTTSADTAIWTAVSSGGTGSVTYSWSGTDGLTDSTSVVTKTYTTSGIKTGTVMVVSGGSSSSATCSIVITISTPPLIPPPTLPQCSDGIDNDSDGLIDFPSDPGCSDSSDTDEIDAPTPPPPTPPQCSDGIDNDSDGLIDFPSDPGCSNSSDTDEIDAPTPPPPTSPTPPSPNPAPLSGGGGGGGGTPIRLEINNEKVERVSTSTAFVTFETNLQANSQVLYDTTSYALSTLPFVEYASSTVKTSLLAIKHSTKISGLNPNTTYYFRPVAFRSIEKKGGVELVLKLGDEVEKTKEPIAPKVCLKYILEPIKFGEDNNIIEVLKLQTFLNDYEGFNLDITGVYNLPTYEAVKTFQKRYVQDILTPWGIEESTGYVYITTMKKINDIYCEKFISFSLKDVSEEERVEIEEFNALFESLRIEGILNIDTSSVGLIDSNEEDSNIDRELASGPVFEDTDRIIEILSNPDTVSVINTLKKDEGVGKKIKNFFNNINITNFLGALFYFTF